jgi:acetyl-CoA acetyltransferase
MEDIVIVSAARTAVGKFGGSLAKVSAPELGSIAIREAIARAGLGMDQIGEVIMGQVLAAGAGQNPARQAMMKAGVAKETPALTINAVCGSGLKAVMLAAQAVAWGDSDIVVAGGQRKHECLASRVDGFTRWPAHGQLEHGRLHDRRWSLGCLQPIPHGHHSRERGQSPQYFA